MLREFGFSDLKLSSVKENVSQKENLSLEAKLNKICEEIGCDTQEKLLSENQNDLMLYEFVRNKNLN